MKSAIEYSFIPKAFAAFSACLDNSLMKRSENFLLNLKTSLPSKLKSESLSKVFKAAFSKIGKATPLNVETLNCLPTIYSSTNTSLSHLKDSLTAFLKACWLMATLIPSPIPPLHGFTTTG
jgi:hypothetical protein